MKRIEARVDWRSWSVGLGFYFGRTVWGIYVGPFVLTVVVR